MSQLGIQSERVWPIMEQFHSSNSVYIGNLDERVTVSILTEAIRPYAENINEVKIWIKSRKKYVFAFMSFSNVDDIYQILQTLRNSSLQLFNRTMSFNMFKRKEPCHPCPVKLPNFTKTEDTFEHQFDLTPEDPKLPCIHALVDDSLFYIFRHLSFYDLIVHTKVCRRFESIINVLLVKQLQEYEDKNICFFEWIMDNTEYREPLQPALDFIRNCGASMKTMQLQSHEHTDHFLYFLGIYCPNLEELHCTRTCNKAIMKYLAENCIKIKTVTIMGFGEMYSKDLKFIFKIFTALQALRIYGLLDVTPKTFNVAPISLKEFSCFGFYQNDKSPWKLFFNRCRELEIFNLKTQISNDDLVYAADSCPNMKEMSVKLLPVGSFKWSVFPKLACLSVTTCRIEPENFKFCENLEMLSIQGLVDSELGSALDFSGLKKLRHLSIEGSHQISNKDLEDLISPDIEYLTIGVKEVAFQSILKCIDSMPKLKSLICEKYSMQHADFQPLYDCCKKRENMLLFFVGVHEFSSDEITMLKNEAKCFLEDKLSDQDYDGYDPFNILYDSDLLEYDDDYDSDSDFFFDDWEDEFVGFDLYDNMNMI